MTKSRKLFVAAYSLCALALCTTACAPVATFNPANPVAMQDSWQVTPIDPSKTLVLIANPEQTCDDSYAMVASGPGATITVTQLDELTRFRGDKYHLCIDGEVVCSKDRPQALDPFISELLWRQPSWANVLPVVGTSSALRTTPFALIVQITPVWDTFTTTYQVDFAISDHRLCTSPYGIQLSGTYTAIGGAGAFFNLPGRNTDLVNLCMRIRLSGVTQADWFPVPQLFGRSTGQVIVTGLEISLGNLRESPDRWDVIPTTNSFGTLRYGETVTVYIPNNIQALGIYEYSLDTGADVCSQLLSPGFLGSSLTYFNSTHYFATASVSRPYGSPGGGQAALCGNFGSDEPWTLLSEIISDNNFYYCEAHGGVFQSDLNTCLYCSADESTAPCNGNGECVLNRENKTQLLLEDPSCACDDGFYGAFCEYATLPTPILSPSGGTHVVASLVVTATTAFSVELDLQSPLTDQNCSSPCTISLSSSTTVRARALATNGSSSPWITSSFILVPPPTTSTTTAVAPAPTTVTSQPEIRSLETTVRIGLIWNLEFRYASVINVSCAKFASDIQSTWIANSTWNSVLLVMPALFQSDWCNEVRITACDSSCTELQLPMVTEPMGLPELSPKIGTGIGTATLSSNTNFSRLLLGPFVVEVTGTTAILPREKLCTPNSEPSDIIRSLNSENDAIFALNSLSTAELSKISCPSSGRILSNSFWLTPTPQIQTVLDISAATFSPGVQDEGQFKLEVQGVSSENTTVKVQPSSCRCIFEACNCQSLQSVVALGLLYETSQHRLSTEWQWHQIQSPALYLDVTAVNTTFLTEVNTSARRTLISWTAVDSPVPIEFEGNCSVVGQSCEYESTNPHTIPKVSVKAPVWYSGFLYFRVTAEQNNQTTEKLVYVVISNTSKSSRNSVNSVSAIFDSAEKDCVAADITMSVLLSAISLLFILQLCVRCFTSPPLLTPKLTGSRAIIRTHKWISWMAPCSLRCGCFHTVNVLRSLSLAWFLLSSKQVVDIFSTVHPVVGPTLLYVILEGIFRFVFHTFVAFGSHVQHESEPAPQPPALDIEAGDLQPKKASLDALAEFDPGEVEKDQQTSSSRAVPWISTGVSFVVFVASWTLALFYGSCTLISPWLPTLILCDIFILETIFVLLTCLYRWQTNSLSENMAHSL